MFDSVRSEVTKIMTLKSILLCSVIFVLLHAFFQWFSLGLYAEAVRGIDAAGTIQLFDGPRVPAVPEMVDQLIASMYTLVPFLPVAAALIGGSEYSTGQIGLSLLGTPSRLRLTLARAVAVVVLTVGLCLAFALVTTAFMYVVVKDWNTSILMSKDVLQGYLRVTLIAVCTNLVVGEIAIIAKRALVGILMVIAFLAVTISQILASFAPALDALFLQSAARNFLFYQSRDVAPPLTSGPLAAILVLVGWVVVAVGLSAAWQSFRDAR